MSFPAAVERTLTAQLPPSADSGAITRIAPTRGWAALHLRELWDHRELLYFLTWRDVKVRYKQTILGAAWAIVQPLTSMVIFTVLARLVKIPSDGIPYPIFTYSGLVPWLFFASATNRASDSLVGNSPLVKKVYFPRLVLPLARVTACLADFIPAFLVLLLMMVYYKFTPSWHIVWVPFFIFVATAAAAGMGFWLSALNVRFRDIGYVAPFLIQIWLYATPVIYPTSLLPARWRFLYALNPMAGTVEGFRWALLGTGDISVTSIMLSCTVAFALLTSGAIYFRRMDRRFADII